MLRCGWMRRFEGHERNVLREKDFFFSLMESCRSFGFGFGFGIGAKTIEWDGGWISISCRYFFFIFVYRSDISSLINPF